jgi:hypothetical protein
MSSVRRGDKNRPSRMKYHSEGRRNRNKVVRIARCNGMSELMRWGKAFGVDVIGILEAEKTRRAT